MQAFARSWHRESHRRASSTSVRGQFGAFDDRVKKVAFFVVKLRSLPRHGREHIPRAPSRGRPRQAAKAKNETTRQKYDDIAPRFFSLTSSLAVLVSALLFGICDTRRLPDSSRLSQASGRANPGRPRGLLYASGP